MPETNNIRSIDTARSYEDRLDARADSKGKRAGAIAGTAAAVGAAGLVLIASKGGAVMDTLKGPSPEDYEKGVEQTVEANPTMLNAKVVVHTGVALRSSPEMKNSDDGGGSSNVMSRVQAGEITVFDHPIVYTNHANQEFLGGRDKEGTYVWINAEALKAEEQNSNKELVTYIVDSNIDGMTSPANYFDGQFYQGATHEQKAATISSMPDEMIDQLAPQYK